MPGMHRDNGVPVVKVRDISKGMIDESNLLLTHPSIDEAYRRSRLKVGDLLLTIRGTTGRVALVPPSLDGANITQDTARLRIGDKTDSRFVYFVLQSELLQQRIAVRTIGQAVKGINIRDIRELSLRIPKTLPEQRAIASALSDVDALLEGLSRLIAKKRDLKQAAMQQLLTGQTRLPGFHGEWEVKPLGNVGRCLRGVSYRGDSDLSSHDSDSTKRLLRSNNVQGAAVVTSNVQFVDASRVKDVQIIQKHDILVCMANGSKSLVGKAGLFQVSDGYAYTFGAFMAVFRTHQNIADARFVFCLFLTMAYRRFVEDLLAGSSINNLRPSLVESFEFSFPAVDEQIAIAEVLSNMDDELSALEARREKTVAIKQAMMQELLTGRTRLV